MTSVFSVEFWGEIRMKGAPWSLKLKVVLASRAGGELKCVSRWMLRAALVGKLWKITTNRLQNKQEKHLWEECCQIKYKTFRLIEFQINSGKIALVEV